MSAACHPLPATHQMPHATRSPHAKCQMPHACGDGSECGHHVGRLRVVRGGAACTLVLVYVSIRLSERVSEFRSIERFRTQDTGHRTTTPPTQHWSPHATCLMPPGSRRLQLNKSLDRACRSIFRRSSVFHGKLLADGKL